MKLTEEQIWKCNSDDKSGVHICLDHQNVVDFARAIEREIGFARADLWLKRINDAVAAERSDVDQRFEVMQKSWADDTKELAVQKYAADNYRRLLDEADHAYAELKDEVDRWKSMYSNAMDVNTDLRAKLAKHEVNEFNPDWDVMAVMVEEQQRMAKRIEELENAMKEHK